PSYRLRSAAGQRLQTLSFELIGFLACRISFADVIKATIPTSLIHVFIEKVKEKGDRIIFSSLGRPDPRNSIQKV
ncbi:MAG: hypothetical protein KAR13_11515, partial [Desulfobulbaceae bacterium]|nr:hypothetical protein [Desulfobulbaceae bacterium]